MKKIIQIAAALALTIAAVNDVKAQNESQYSDTDKIIEIAKLINTVYPDTMPQAKIFDYTLHAMLLMLDPHSVYKNPEEAAEDNKQNNCDKVGIGAYYATYNDTLTVIDVKPRTPAAKAGLKNGTKVESINDEKVANRILSDDDILDIIALREDSIKLNIYRPHGGIKTVTIPRIQLQQNTISACYAPNDSTTYLKITTFNRYTGSQFKKAIGNMSRKELKNVIIDLRDNRGGTLTSAKEILNQITPANMMLYKMVNKHHEIPPEFANKDGKLKQSRIYILINEASGSASEVVASSVQDNDRGIIIGRRSYGKGMSQQVITLKDGSKVNITNGWIQAPSGRHIQKPFTRGKYTEYFDEISQRRARLEHLYADSISTTGKPMHKTVIRNRIVYGQMGVVPDLFVAEDSTNKPQNMRDTIYIDIIHDFAYKYVDAHRARLNSTYGSFKKFETNFHVSDAIEMAIRRPTSPLENIMEAPMPQPSNKYVKTFIKASIAEALFGENEFRQILNEADSDFKAAIRLVTNPQSYWNYLH